MHWKNFAIVVYFSGYRCNCRKGRLLCGQTAVLHLKLGQLEWIALFPSRGGGTNEQQLSASIICMKLCWCSRQEHTVREACLKVILQNIRALANVESSLAKHNSCWAMLKQKFDRAFLFNAFYLNELCNYCRKLLYWQKRSGHSSKVMFYMNPSK